MLSKIINRETVLYGIFGVFTSLLNIALFQILLMLSVGYRTANFFTLVVVKLVAYICNKNFVFQSRTGNWIELAKEFGRFVIARSTTMLIDYFGLIVLVEICNFDKMISKIFLTILVIIINYFVGKKHVFKNVKKNEGMIVK